MSTLKEWLRRESLWVYAGEVASTVITHVFLDGGRACVPLQRMRDFFIKYAETISKEERPCVVERIAASKDGAFRMFADVDLKAFEGSMDDVADELTHALPAELDQGSIILCKRRSGKASDDRHGLHIIWEDVVVASSEDALKLAAVLLSNLTHLFPGSAVDWTSALDGSVYKNSGLRMVLSAKGPSDASMYVPWRLSRPRDDDASERVFEDINEKDVSGDMVSWLERCSILPPAGQVVTKVSLASVNNEKSFKSVKYRSKSKKSQSITCENAVDAVLLGTAYEGCRHAAPIFRDKDCATIQLESRFCYNIGREHKSNRVYLIVSRHKVEQACFCRCAHTGCASHRKVLVSTSNALSDALFGPYRVPDVRPTTVSRSILDMESRIKRQRTGKRLV